MLWTTIIRFHKMFSSNGIQKNFKNTGDKNQIQWKTEFIPKYIKHCNQLVLAELFSVHMLEFSLFRITIVRETLLNFLQ